MAYKFQLGKAKLSGSVELTQQLKVASGGLSITGSVDLPVDAIENAELLNSTISGKELGTNLDSLSAAVNGGLSTFSYNGSGAVTVALTSSIAGAGLAWSAGVLSVDTAEIAAGLSGSVEAMIGAFVEGSDFVTFDDVNGTIGVDAAKFSGSFSAALATKSTTNLAEGTNLYYTDTRARNAVSAVDAGGDGSFSYNSATGAFTYTGPSATEVRKHIASSDFISYDSGSGFVGVLGANFTGSVRNAVGVPASSGLSYNKAVGEFAVSSSIAGEALGLTGGVLNVQTDASSVEVYGDQLRVKAAGITNAMLAGSIANDKLLAIENAKLVNSSVTVNGTAGEVTVSSPSLALGGTTTISLPATITKNLAFSGQVTINNLNVTGTLTTINTANLEVADARILMASGSTAWATNVGFDFGSHVGHATLLTADVDMGGVGGVDSLSSSLPLVAPAVKAETFYGNFVGASILGIATVSAATADISANVTRANAASQVLTLPSAPVAGQEHRIKCVVADASNPVIVIQPYAEGKIEGVVDAQITLESFGAAVSLVYGGSTEGWMVF